MADYILHDGMDEDYQDIRYASINNGGAIHGTGGSAHLSSLMMASDDLEIPLINNDNNLHNHHSGGGGGGGAGGECCLFGQRGFRPGFSEYSSNKKAKQQLIVATLICFLFMIAELIGGLMAGSLAVVTDAAHLLSDCIGFIVAMVAISLAKKMPDAKMSFGYKRFEVLGAVISVLGIWLLTGILVYMAVLRVIDQNFQIDADTMIIISVIGVVINIVMASVLHGNCINIPFVHGHSHNHGHSHCGGHSKAKSSNSIGAQLPPLPSNVSSSGLALKDDVVLTHGVINMHSTSIHTTHSRHNSFSKTLPNGGTLLDTSESIPGGNDKPFARSNLENHICSTAKKNGSYTLLRIGSNDDAINADSHTLMGCDSEVEEDADEEVLDEDLKLGQSTDTTSNNLNIRAAMIHVIGDFVQSVGVLISAVVIKFYPEAKLVDPACTFIFSVIVFFTTIRIMKESLVILLNAVPMTINLSKLEKELRCIDGVRSVHYLNVFGISVDWNVMAVHLVIDNMTSGEEVIRTVSKLVKRAYNIKHVTVQIEKLKTKLPPTSSSSPLHQHNPFVQSGNELI